MSFFRPTALKTTAAALAVALTALTLPAGAQAGSWESRHWDGHRGYYGDRGWDRPRGYYGHRHHHRRDRDDAGAAVAAGVVGLAAGTLLGSALTAPRAAPVYVEPAPVYAAPPPVYVEPAPVYAVPARNPLVVYDARPAPWTPEWYAYCSSKYRSFDANSGTYQPYNGPRQLCQ
ncbi:BA14K family protein [Afifella sp. JA880]|uniref:BA14K family protein n=1 Tax=Afifella sp. JA880 TaxID=2975280 RepID=UPI0021BB42E9|nr:BA14K family protein [Afifella sp. JA880]MCT8266161.1 BA14K family protein [Afifella sp. JA880]